MHDALVSVCCNTHDGLNAIPLFSPFEAWLIASWYIYSTKILPQLITAQIKCHAVFCCAPHAKAIALGSLRGSWYFFHQSHPVQPLRASRWANIWSGHTRWPLHFHSPKRSLTCKMSFTSTYFHSRQINVHRPEADKVVLVCSTSWTWHQTCQMCLRTPAAYATCRSRSPITGIKTSPASSQRPSSSLVSSISWDD